MKVNVFFKAYYAYDLVTSTEYRSKKKKRRGDNKKKNTNKREPTSKWYLRINLLYSTFLFCFVFKIQTKAKLK